MIKKYIGIEFLDMKGKVMKVESFFDKFNRYYVTYDHMGTKLNELMTIEDIELYLNKQEEIKKDIELMNEIIIKKKQEEDQKKKKYEFVHGFCDNIEPMQKAKMLTVLNKVVSYNGKYKSRKEHIESMLKEGYNPIIKDEVMSSNRKINLERIVKYKYNVPVMEKGNEFLEITKTEYNYAIYLLDKLELV